MDVNAPTVLLGGLSPAAFMRRYWQKRPLLVRQACPGARPPLTRAELLALAARDEVESRLVARRGTGWTLRHGPMPRSALPPLRQPGWTLLVQGLDLHVSAARALLERFRFVPDARLDDLMLSYATDQGGVGPHLDTYDVFLLQVHGRRRWRIARPGDDSLVEGLPLKILRHFEPEFEWVLEPGDLLSKDAKINIRIGEHHLTEPPVEIGMTRNGDSTERLHRQPCAHGMGEDMNASDPGRP